jgi:hypothetical protein
MVAFGIGRVFYTKQKHNGVSVSTIYEKQTTLYMDEARSGKSIIQRIRSLPKKYLDKLSTARLWSATGTCMTNENSESHSWKNGHKIDLEKGELIIDKGNYTLKAGSYYAQLVPWHG